MRNILLSAVTLLLCQSVTAQSWQRISGTGNRMYSIGTNAQNTNAVWIGGFREIYRSYNKGISVSDTVVIPFNTGIITTIFIHPLDTSLVIVGSGNGCHITRDAGVTWNHALPDTSVLLIGDSIALEPGTSDTLYVALFSNQQDSSRTFFRSFDRGQSWTSLPPAPGQNPFRICAITAVGENRIFAGRQLGGIYRSTNGGESWSPSYIPALLEFEVPAIVQDRSRPGTIWATVLNFSTANNGKGSVVYSMSNGNQWTNIPINGNPWGLDTDLKGIVYVGLFGDGAPGALFSQTLGASWIHNSSGFALGTTASVWMLKTSNDGSVLYLADDGLGAYRWVLSGGTTSVGQEFGEPIFVLPQNYPNPFNPSTTIQFSLTHKQFVSLKIFNLLGQEVAELLNVELDAGTHEVPFHANGLPSGTYIYRLQAGNVLQSGRMVLAK